MKNIKEINLQTIIAIIATIGLIATLIMVFIGIYKFNQRIDGVFISVNQNLSVVNQRIDGVYEILIKSDKGIEDMKTRIEARFASIEKRLTAIDTGISSLQPRDDSLKEDKPHTETAPYQEGESGQKTSPYQSP